MHNPALDSAEPSTQQDVRDLNEPLTDCETPYLTHGMDGALLSEGKKYNKWGEYKYVMKSKHIENHEKKYQLKTKYMHANQQKSITEKPHMKS